MEALFIVTQQAWWNVFVLYCNYKNKCLSLILILQTNIFQENVSGLIYVALSKKGNLYDDFF